MCRSGSASSNSARYGISLLTSASDSLNRCCRPETLALQHTFSNNQLKWTARLTCTMPNEEPAAKEAGEADTHVMVSWL
jgi:hypothetical protein